MNKELDLSDISSIKRKLSSLRKTPGSSCFLLIMDRFYIRMYTNAEYSDPPNIEFKNINDYNAVSVEVWEDASSLSVGIRVEVKLWEDYRFIDFYTDNKYTEDEWDWKNGILMPMHIVYNLIKHIDRIVNLAPFY